MGRLNSILVSPIVFLLTCFLISCSKDKLTGDYAMFKGSYKWVSTPLDNGNIFSNQKYTLLSTETGFEILLELNGSGEAIFYKDGSQISKNKYTITEKEFTSTGNGKISVKLKGSTGSMNINKNTLTLVLSGDTMLSVDEFPIPSLEKAEKYKSGYSQSGSNKFLRK